MPKLPADFVKAPTFDNPLRATAGKLVLAKDGRDVVIHFEDSEWAAIEAACAEEGVTPEALVKRAVAGWISRELAAPVAPSAAELPPASSDVWRPGGLLGLLVERVEARLERYDWFKRYWPLPAARA